MKLVQTAKTLQTNADFVSQDFSIGDTSKIIEILRNKMYKHKVRTLVQEYISNARDAMREIKSSDKIAVTIPTMFSPTFKVRDYGPGITPDRMVNVFIKYGASTKDKSNEQTGGFGIGAKSAWSYTESFTIVTFIDGIQRTYIAHIGANNNGRLDFLGESSTNQSNGTEIQIPVSVNDLYEFKKSIFRATYFWSDEEKPKFLGISADDKVERIIGETINNLEVNNELPDCVASKWNTGIILSIDGIPYFIDGTMIDKIANLKALAGLVTGRLVIHLDNGQVEVAASREELSDSKYTLDKLDNIAKDALKDVNDKIIKEFSKAKGPFDHLSIYMKLKDSFNLEKYRVYGDFTVNNKDGIESSLFNQTLMHVCTVKTNGELNKRDFNKQGWYNRRNNGIIKSKEFNSLYFIDGTEKMIETNQRIRSLLYMPDSVVIVVTKLPTDKGEFDLLKSGLGLKDLKTVTYVKTARQTRASIKIERTKKEFCIHSYESYRNRSKYITLDNNTKKWYYIDNSDTTYSTIQLSDLCHYTMNKGYSICGLSKAAMSRVKGDKNFKPLADFITNFKVSDNDINALKYNASLHKDIIDKLKKLTGIDDKFLNKMIAEYKTHSYKTIPDVLKKLIGNPKEVDDFRKLDADLNVLLKTKYPLLQEIYKWSNEVVYYINAK